MSTPARQEPRTEPGIRPGTGPGTGPDAGPEDGPEDGPEAGSRYQAGSGSGSGRSPVPSTAPRLGPAARRRYANLVLRWLLLAVAVVAVLNAGLRVEVGAGVTTGHVLGLALLPLWMATAARYRHVPALLLLTAAAVLTGVWLTAASAGAYEVSASMTVQNAALLAGIVTGAGLILWLRPVLSEWQIGLVYGLGLLAEATTIPGLDNPWKYQWGMPLAVLALAAVQALNSRLAGVLTLLAFVVASALQDSRSLTGMFLVAALVLALQALPLPRRLRHLGAGRVVLLVGVLGLAAYELFTRLALSGVLGLSTQLRTQEQALRAGSVLLGGRPEMGATAGLFLHRPEGFGAGTVLNPEGIAAAQQAMGRLNYDPDNGYVYNYMFGRSLEVHSGLGDLWAMFGLPGLVLGLLLVWALVDALARRFSTRSLTPLQGAALLFTLWTMFFGPLYTVAPILSLCLGLMLVPRGEVRFLGLRRPGLPTPPEAPEPKAARR
ncbi:hypothetical protein ACH9EU_18040 [Kocuria sp. M1R5S2]|uniref:hypothetical protein n=1 Tax=Kocuria rhizosphaerae TaxID=3376285 RepID=UPI0037910463